MPDLDEVPRKHVTQKASDERSVAEGGRTPVSRQEPHSLVVHPKKPGVGDRDSVRVEAQIAVDLFRSPEGSLGIDHPLVREEPPDHAFELLLGHLQLSGRVPAPERVDELPPEEP